MVQLDPKKIREDFPILHQKVYGKDFVYLDNAATTQKPQSVIDTLSHLYATQNGNIHRGVHYMSQESTRSHEAARKTIADYIGAEKEEIIFTRGTTESINMIASLFAQTFCEQGDEIIISEMEHHSNIVPWQMACERYGLTLQVVPINEAGELDMQAYASLLNQRTRIVSIAHISNVLGTINPIAQIIAMAHQKGAKVLIDGAQGIAHAPVDVKALDVDFYVFSGHKIYAPTGIGVLYGKSVLLNEMPPYQGGGEMIETVTFKKTTYNELPYKYEAGTPNYIGSVALAKAIEYVQALGLDAIEIYEQELLEYAQSQLEKIEGIRFIGTAQHKCSLISFVIDGVHPYDLGMLLDKMGIAVRTGHHCAQPLMEVYEIPGTVRVSFAFYNTKEEIDSLMKAMQRALMILR